MSSRTAWVIEQGYLDYTEKPYLKKKNKKTTNKQTRTTKLPRRKSSNRASDSDLHSAVPGERRQAQRVAQCVPAQGCRLKSVMGRQKYK